MEQELELEEAIEEQAVKLAQVDEPAFNPKRGNWPDSVEQWRPLLAGHLPPEQVETGLCVINGESRGDPAAKNKSSSAAGMWQFLKSTWDKMVHPHLGGLTYDEGGPYNPELATLYAAWLWEAEGWTQWAAYRHCR
jgi:hypothetical protein